MFRHLLLTACAFVICVPVALAEDQPADQLWQAHVSKLLKQRCSKCHNAEKHSNGLDVSSLDTLLRGGERGPAVKPGDAEASLLFQVLQPEGKPHMPPGGKQLPAEEIAIVERWINRLEGTAAPPSEKTTAALETAPVWKPPAGAQPSTVINLLVEARWAARGVEPAPPCDDRTFVRRVYLDLLGRIPTLDELQQFESATESDKRGRLVDELLTRPEHAVHVADVFDTLLMGRKKKAQTYERRQTSGWRGYLERAFRNNRPWNVVTRELLLARPGSKAAQGSTWFLFERNNDHQAIAEAVAPAVFGVRVECAQCHDHPLASEIEQAHYWGLVAFFRRGKNVNTKNGPRLAEAAIGGFEEFSDLAGDSHPNLLAFLGSKTVEEPRPAKGKKEKDRDELYRTAAAKGDPRVPKFSRREKFVDQVLTDHPLVARAMVNRLWAMLLGRGIVHPHDKLDSAHPPSHPQLLDWLADDYRRSGYDTRRLIRQIVLSRPYQLASRKPSKDADPADFTWSLEKPLIAESWTRALTRLVRGETDLDADLLRDFRQQFPDVLPEESVAKLAQAMFLSNSPQLHQYLSNSNDDEHLRARLLGLSDHAARVDHLFRTAYSREPTEEELDRSVQFLAEREQRLKDALDQLIWAIVTSAEFRLNH